MPCLGEEPERFNDSTIQRSLGKKTIYFELTVEGVIFIGELTATKFKKIEHLKR